MELETALSDVLRRIDAGEEISGDELFAAYPDCHDDLIEVLALEGRLAASAPPAAIGPYRVREAVGRGATSIVFRAETEDGQVVAVKVLRERPAHIPRVDAANVVRTLGSGEHEIDGVLTPYVVTEFIEGRSLREMLDELGSLPEPLCRHIAAEIARGLAAVHAAGLVHRDVKPDNVMLGVNDAVTLMDLGLAEAARGGGRLDFAGSMNYAAPEQVAGDAVDGRADLYALGLTLIELLTGEPFLDGETFPDLRGRASAFFEEVLRTLLAPDPSRRLASAVDLCDVLAEGENSAWWQGRRTGRRARRFTLPGEASCVGRDEELRVLADAWASAREGRGRVVFVEGAAGVGKTRLVDEFVARLDLSGAQVLAGFGSPAEPTPMLAAVRWFIDDADPRAVIDACVFDSKGLVAPFAGLLGGDDTVDLDADSLGSVYTEFLKGAARAAPTIVVLENLHDASRADRRLFWRVARTIAREPILLVATTRPGVAAEELEHGRRLCLATLPPESSAQLIAEYFAPGRLAPMIADSLIDRASGSPLLLLALARDLEDRNALHLGTGGVWTWRARDVSTPASLRELTADRVARLDAESRQLLELAACAGERADPKLLSRAGALPLGSVLRRLAALARRHHFFRFSDAEIAFDHDLVRAAVYEGQGDVARRRNHRALALALSDEPVDGPRALSLCKHWLESGDGERAAAHVDQAVAYCESHFLSEPLLDLTRALLAMDLPDARRVDLLLIRVKHLHVLGLHDQERADLEAAIATAERTGDPVLCGRAYNDWGLLLGGTKLDDEAVQAADRAIRYAVEGGDIALELDARTNRTRTLYDLNRFDESHEERARVEALFKKHPEPNVEITFHGHVARCAFMAGDWEGAERGYARVFQLASGMGKITQQVSGLGHLGLIARHRRDMDKARRLAGESLALARRYGYRTAECHLLREHVYPLLIDGRLDAALEHVERWLDLSVEIGLRVGEMEAHTFRASTLLLLGAHDEALRDFERVMLLSELQREGDSEYPTLRGLAWLAYLNGDVEESDRLYATRFDRDAGSARLKVDHWLDRARLLVRQARVDEAVPFLEQALAADPREDERVRALALLAAIGRGEARVAVAAAKNASVPIEVAHRIEIQWDLWRATRTQRHLDAAAAALGHLRDHAPPQYRDSMLHHNPLFRDVTAVRGGTSATGGAAPSAPMA